MPRDYCDECGGDVTADCHREPEWGPEYDWWVIGLLVSAALFLLVLGYAWGHRDGVNLVCDYAMHTCSEAGL